MSLKGSRNQVIVLGFTGIAGALLLCIFTFIGSSVIQDSVQPPVKTDGEVKFVNEFGELHGLEVEVADTADEQREGLMFRTFMPEDQGMLFVFEEAQKLTFWMKNTLIPLDIIYLDSEQRVVSFHENTKIQQTDEVYPSKFPAQFVIEANAGWVQRTELTVGDVFNLTY